MPPARHDDTSPALGGRWHLLQQRDRERREASEALRIQARIQLRQALAEVALGEPVYLFGSITRPGTFRRDSDIDIAFVHEPQATKGYKLASMLEDIVGRPVDLIQLTETRFRETILKEGEPWIG